MQDILSTSPIIPTRHQTSSTPNIDDTKTVKAEPNNLSNFYTAHVDDSTPGLTSAMVFHYNNQNRNNSSNFSVSNLANLENHQQRDWSYNSAKTFNPHTYSYPTQYQTYPDTTNSNNFICNHALPISHLQPFENVYSNIDTTSSSPKNSPGSNVHQSYPIYNPLSSSQISSSSFNTSQSSNKSNSPKLTDFTNQCQSQNHQQVTLQQHQGFVPVKLEQIQQNLNNVSSLSPLSSLISNSSCNVSSASSNFNIQNQNNLTQISNSVNGTVPGAESFEWMKPAKSQPNGKTRTKDKYRVVYTEPQRVELEKEFLYSKYITIKRKSELSLTLGLSERQIKIWFQNRRAKDRKTSRKQRSDNSTNSALRNSEFSSGFDNDSDVSVNEEDMSDIEEELSKIKKTKKSLKANPENKINNNNNINDDMELVQKRQHMTYAQQTFVNQASGFNGAVFNSNTPPGSVGAFSGYTHQLNSTPTYNHYFNQGVVSSNQAVLNSNFDYQNYQYGAPSFAVGGQGSEYSNLNQTSDHDQYHHYYQQQHLLLNGASI